MNYSKSLKQDTNYKKMIFNKKRAFFQNKLTEFIGKFKGIWKALKSLGLPYKVSSCEVKSNLRYKTVFCNKIVLDV